MKIFIALLLCLLLWGCDRVSIPEIPVATPGQRMAVDWQAVVFADSDTCHFRVDSCVLEKNGDYTVTLVCQNRESGTQLFSCGDWCVDGWQVLEFWGEEVPGGVEATFQVTIPARTLARSGITLPRSLAFDLRIFSLTNLEQNYRVSARCYLYPTGETPGKLEPPPVTWEEDDFVLVDNNGCSLVLTDFRQEAGQYQVDCLLENKTRQRQLYRLYGFCFNGQESDRVWTLHLSPGAKCAVTMELELPMATGYVRDFDLKVYICQSDIWFGRIWAQEQFHLQPPWKPE